MSQLVELAREGGVMVALIENPPVNALTEDVLAALVAAVDEATQDPEVQAIVIAGGGRTFMAGADIGELQSMASGERPPVRYAEMLRRVEDSPKPVVVAIHGAALGGGLETAMAGHWRIAHSEAQFGQPEIKLGLIPGAGGTQRLPRLTGVQRAFDMCVFGEPIGAAEALDAGIVDRVVGEDLLAAAMAFARELPPVRRTRDLAGKLASEVEMESLAALAQDAAGRRLRGQRAPIAVIEAIAATARFGFDQGMEVEQALFEECLHGTQARALIHVFFAERAAPKVAGLPKDIRPRAVRRAAVVGAGSMGAGIAMTYANAGIPVLLQDAAQDSVDHAIEAIRRNYAASVQKGRLSPDRAAERLALITPTTSYDSFSDADIVVEAVYEELPLKQRIFSELGRVTRSGTILATNTSTLDVDAIAGASTRPEFVVGQHFFNPAHVMRLLEIVRGKKTSPEVLATVLDLARRLKKVAVVSRNAFGFIGNRMFLAFREQAIRLAEEGASPWQVDKALTDWGMAMGPLAVGDLSGLDIWQRIRLEAIYAGVGHLAARNFEDALIGRGRLGQKSGEGWYRYDADRRPSPDPDVDGWLLEYSGLQGIERRSFTDRQILERTLFAMVNEGARLLEAQTAQRASDLDIVFVTGYGFPAWRGGPMHWASALGLRKVSDALERFHDTLGPAWRPAPLLERLARTGKSFDDFKS
jgi:3-hydroxyacyl-CoA dehydrogenase